MIAIFISLSFFFLIRCQIAAKPNGLLQTGILLHELFEDGVRQELRRRVPYSRIGSDDIALFWVASHEYLSYCFRYLERRLASLSWCREQTELLRHAQGIVVVPVFHHFAIDKARDQASRQCHGLAGWGASQRDGYLTK
jgi:hypothetical protein